MKCTVAKGRWYKCADAYHDFNLSSNSCCCQTFVLRRQCHGLCLMLHRLQVNVQFCPKLMINVLTLHGQTTTWVLTVRLKKGHRLLMSGFAVDNCQQKKNKKMWMVWLVHFAERIGYKLVKAEVPLLCSC